MPLRNSTCSGSQLSMSTQRCPFPAAATRLTSSSERSCAVAPVSSTKKLRGGLDWVTCGFEGKLCANSATNTVSAVARPCHPELPFVWIPRVELHDRPIADDERHVSPSGGAIPHPATLPLVVSASTSCRPWCGCPPFKSHSFGERGGI